MHVLMMQLSQIFGALSCALLKKSEAYKASKTRYRKGLKVGDDLYMPSESHSMTYWTRLKIAGFDAHYSVRKNKMVMRVKVCEINSVHNSKYKILLGEALEMREYWLESGVKEFGQ